MPALRFLSGDGALSTATGTRKPVPTAASAKREAGGRIRSMERRVRWRSCNLRVSRGAPASPGHGRAPPPPSASRWRRWIPALRTRTRSCAATTRLRASSLRAPPGSGSCTWLLASPLLEAVIVALPVYEPLARFEEHGEVRTHLRSGGKRTQRYGQYARPSGLHCHVVARRQFAQDLEGLGGQHLPALKRSGEDGRQVARLAARIERVRQLHLDRVRGEEPGQ